MLLNQLTNPSVLFTFFAITFKPVKEFLKMCYELFTVLSPLFTDEDFMQNSSALFTFDDCI
jgi:hypothetical protein